MFDEYSFEIESAAASPSYQFLLDLRRAQAESLREAKKTANEPNLSDAEIAQIQVAQALSMKEETEREKALERLRQRLAHPWNLEIGANTDATGNCQFDSAADQLHRYDDTEHITHQQVRAQVVEWLKRNKEYRLGDQDSETLESWIMATQGLSWPDYCLKMGTPEQWGDEVTMKAITEVFQCRIFLWSSTVSEENYFSEHLPQSALGSEPAVAVSTKTADEKPLFESVLPAPGGCQGGGGGGSVSPKKTLLLCHVLEVHYGSLHLRQQQPSVGSPESTASSLQRAPNPTVSLTPSHKLALLKTLFGEDRENKLSESIVEFVASAQQNHLSMAVNTLIDLSRKLRPDQQKSKPSHPLVSAPSDTVATPALNESEELLSDFVVVESVTNQAPVHIEVKKMLIPPTEELDQQSSVSPPQQTCLASFFECSRGQERADDWLALSRVGTTPNEYHTFWKTGGTSEGLVSYMCPPSLWGEFEFRWMRSNYAVLGRSRPFHLGPVIELKCDFNDDGTDGAVTVNRRQIRVQVTNSGDPCTTSWDWVGLFPTGEKKAHRYLSSAYVDRVYSFAVLPTPSSVSSFEVRFFSGHRKYKPLACVALYITAQGLLTQIKLDV